MTPRHWTVELLSPVEFERQGGISLTMTHQTGSSSEGRRLAQKKKSVGGIKFFKGALGHRRADKYLFANKENYRGKSYRDLWRASGRNDTFENWLKSEGIDLSKY